jgi:hypothetical protein
MDLQLLDFNINGIAISVLGNCGCNAERGNGLDNCVVVLFMVNSIILAKSGKGNVIARINKG